MSEQFEAHPKELKSLLRKIHDGEIALPDFQRDFVWPPRSVEDLLESILREYPAGNLLCLRGSGKFPFALRSVEDAPKAKAPNLLLLDGQQRLTSLYQSLYGVGRHRYFMKMKVLLENNDNIENSIVCVQAQHVEREFGTPEKQIADLVFPLASVFGGVGFHRWLYEKVEPTHGQKWRGELLAINDRWINNIEKYKFPVTTLSEKTELAAICSIFETLNRTGVKLTVFDLLTAKYYPQDVRLRDMWDSAKQDNKQMLARFYKKGDPYHIIQAVAIHMASENGRALSCKRGDVLKMDAKDAQKGWDPVVGGVIDTLTILRDLCGVVAPKYLPYDTMLIPAGAVLASYGDAKGLAKGEIRDKVKRWFWCSVFTQAYENSPNTQAVSDYRALRAWIEKGSVPEVVEKFKFDPEELREITPRQRALYYACLALMLSMNPTDFYTRENVATMVAEGSGVDDHHVFPKGYLKGDDKTAENCVLNRTLISDITNRKISKKSPAEYLGDIENEKGVGVAVLTKILDSHLLPSEADSPLRKNDFEAFLAKRQELLYDKIKEVTGLK